MNGKYVVSVLLSVIVLSLAGIACDRSASEPVSGDVQIKSQDAENAESASVKTVESLSVAEAPAWLGEFFGDKLVEADGSEISSGELAGKKIGIYFSAHWCPPCRGFTPVLVEAYNKIVAAGKPFEIVFVSSDYSEAKMFNYMTETKMPWKALPFGSGKKYFLNGKCGVRGIPALIVVDENGKMISNSARGDVVYKGAAAFDGWK
jgi:thiol-disulfide isomerase/thioredoxin